MTAMFTAPSQVIREDRREIRYWIAGLAFTFALFFSMARLQNGRPNMRPAGIEDSPLVSLPFEPPPPTPQVTEPARPEQSETPLTGIEVGRSDSPIKIAVAPADIEALIPASPAPKAIVQIGRLPANFKPSIGISVDLNHVYQQSEVDQQPRAIVRVTPPVPEDLFGNGHTLRVVLLLIIDANGRAERTRVIESSGKPQFDAIVAQTVTDQWVFAPAVRRGKKVRCLAQQAFRVNLPGGSPFSIQ